MPANNGDADSECGQQGVLERGPLADGEPPQIDGEHQLKQRRQDEGRDRRRDDGHDLEADVQGIPPPDCGNDPQQRPGREAEHQRLQSCFPPV